ncbi:2-amino-4-hydroxy-6-hydroxymethyldihydropteridine diphosphokinase [Noviherbaspirillum sedimenti]|uniref:2-amino-4-hydroxy-6-hydroxymethyldihydropteridine pyrophosphokinase n=1 Tax=Noviherbaspirillum sedimenti TaxID=2320865 RepID=A0A3A3G855_9BURK|nr:2-amino-4-hydroxy-6-hydroxymethyldihydropteridine diphosphokinase [Noviherbaspirillum sedimenti]RJG03815.1 2-amino-4-hydroxy-6-hydroxymethyldihydropteridine diphosphokinase [Noviherbaspirillum sedimenti]
MTATVSAYIGIGANLGDARTQVEQALAALGRLPQCRLAAQSSLFRTAPIDAGGDDFINAVARLDTALPAQDLLEQLQALELAAGRERPFRNAPRTLDLDILLYGEQIIATSSLRVPHPRLTERAFALIPLLQIDPFIAIPGAGPAHQFAAGVAGQAIRKI